MHLGCLKCLSGACAMQSRHSELSSTARSEPAQKMYSCCLLSSPQHVPAAMPRNTESTWVQAYCMYPTARKTPWQSRTRQHRQRRRLQRICAKQQHVEDPYAVLGIPYGSSQEEARSAYLEQIKRLHPDVNPLADTTQQAVMLNAAYADIQQVCSHTSFPCICHMYTAVTCMHEHRPERLGILTPSRKQESRLHKALTMSCVIEPLIHQLAPVWAAAKAMLAMSL